jgi:hypothetical protein
MVTPPDIEAQILRLYHAENWTVGTIARQLHIHHSVMRRVLAQSGLPKIGPRLAVPHVARPQGHGSVRSAYDPAGRLAHDPPASGGGRHDGADRQSFLSRDGHHGVSLQWWRPGALEHAQEMAAHESPRTTKLYDRTNERLTQDEVERIRL